MPACGRSFRNQPLHELVNHIHQLIRGLLAVRHSGFDPSKSRTRLRSAHLANNTHPDERRGATGDMTRDPEVAALIEQAARNLATLELLGGQEFKRTIEELQLRLQRLKEAYTRETDSLTQQVLRRAIERRRGGERRRRARVEAEGAANDKPQG